MNILIIGDIHFRLNNPMSRKDDLKEVFEDKFNQIRNLIKEKDVKYVITTGDVFDKAKVTNETLWFAHDLIQSLKIPVISIVGNHDMIGNSINNHKLSSLYLLQKLCDNLIIEPNYLIKDLNIIGNNYGNDNFIIDNINKSYKNIIVTHSMITENVQMFDTIKAEDIITNADLIITGHNHSKFHIGKVYNPGALIRLTTGKGDMDRVVEVGILDSDTLNIEKIPLKITPYSDIFEVKEVVKKQEFIMKELSESMSTITTTNEIIDFVIKEENPDTGVINELKRRLS